jgi:hypothetical protein
MGSVHMTAREWRRSWPAWLRGTAIGFPFGTMPAGGSEIPTFLSYATERKLSKHQDEFGTTGAIEGVAGPEAANNAAVTATLVPLLTLGIPTSVTAAILLSALQNYGINAGPQLFQTSSTLVWALIASLYIGNVMLLVLNLPLVGLWVKLLKIPRPPLYAGILIFATVGCLRHAAEQLRPVPDVRHRLLGVLMRRFDFPDRAGHRRHDPGPAGRGADAQCAVDRRRPLERVHRPPDVGHAAGGGGGGAGAAAPAGGSCGARAPRAEFTSACGAHRQRTLALGVVGTGAARVSQPCRWRSASAASARSRLGFVVQAGHIAEVLAATRGRRRALPGRSLPAFPGSRRRSPGTSRRRCFTPCAASSRSVGSV